ncbi:MAG: hypothetical protein ABSG54_14600 [Terriglobia bacterium]
MRPVPRYWYPRVIVGRREEAQNPSRKLTVEGSKSVEPAGRKTPMIETPDVQEAVVAPCVKCGWIKFNPDCPECREIQEQCLLLGAGIEGFDL